MKNVAISGDTPEDIALEVAEFTENTPHRRPGALHETYTNLKAQGRASGDEWTEVFRDQTGQNVNVAINGIKELLVKIASDAGR